MKTAVLIPVYEPDEKLIELVNTLTVMPFPLILVVDDGSAQKNSDIFDYIETLPNCRVIHHKHNLGKGAALKTGFRILLAENNDFSGCVTVDADGQHLPEDIYHVAAVVESDNRYLVLGCRDFDNKTVPAKSKFGNIITRLVYTLFTNRMVTDTQTGLRAIPMSMLAEFLKVPGERYEYEMNMLIRAAKSNLLIKEVTIQTVYLDENKHSHFKPFVDSFRVYREFIEFGLSSLVCSLLDIGLFTLLFHTLSMNNVSWALFGATSLARLVSSVSNFTLNKHVVFESKNSILSQASKYFMLVTVQMILSWLILQGLSSLSDRHVVLLKIFTDISLFFVSFFVQRIFIFGKHIYHEKTA